MSKLGKTEAPEEDKKTRAEWQCIDHTGQDLTDFDKSHNRFLCGMCLHKHRKCNLVRLIGLQGELENHKMENEKGIAKAKEVYQQGAAELESMKCKGKERIQGFINHLQKLIEDMTAGLNKYNKTIEADIDKAILQIASLPEKCDQNILLISKIINCEYLPKGEIRTSEISDFCLNFDDFMKKLREPQRQLKEDMTGIGKSFEKFEQKLKIFSTPLQKFKESIWSEVFSKDSNGAFQIINKFMTDRSKTALTAPECLEASRVILENYKLTLVPTLDDINEEFEALDVLQSGDLPAESVLDLIKNVVQKLSTKAGVEILPSTILPEPESKSSSKPEPEAI